MPCLISTSKYCVQQELQNEWQQDSWLASLTSIAHRHTGQQHSLSLLLLPLRSHTRDDTATTLVPTPPLKLRPELPELVAFSTSVPEGRGELVVCSEDSMVGDEELVLLISLVPAQLTLPVVVLLLLLLLGAIVEQVIVPLVASTDTEGGLLYCCCREVVTTTTVEVAGKIFAETMAVLLLLLLGCWRGGLIWHCIRRPWASAWYAFVMPSMFQWKRCSSTLAREGVTCNMHNTH